MQSALIHCFPSSFLSLHACCFLSESLWCQITISVRNRPRVQSALKRGSLLKFHYFCPRLCCDKRNLLKMSTEPNVSGPPRTHTHAPSVSASYAIAEMRRSLPILTLPGCTSGTVGMFVSQQSQTQVAAEPVVKETEKLYFNCLPQFDDKRFTDSHTA